MSQQNRSPSTQSGLEEYLQRQKRQMQYLDQQVQLILSQNRIDDLERFLRKRQSLHNWNQQLQYLFLFTQAAGILIVSISNAIQYNNLIWVGAGLNLLAGVFQGIQQVNTKLSNKLFHDLEDIKSNRYVDEGAIGHEGITSRSDNNQNKMIDRFAAGIMQQINTAEFGRPTSERYAISELEQKQEDPEPDPDAGNRDEHQTPHVV